MAYWAWEGNCYRCKVAMAMDQATYTAMKQSGKTWCCPYGHEQHFAAGKTEAEKLREQLEAERRARQLAEQRNAQKDDEIAYQRRSAIAYKGQATKLRNRATAGTCPCCKRTFKQLAAHMANKHPGFTPEQPDVTIQ